MEFIKGIGTAIANFAIFMIAGIVFLGSMWLLLKIGSMFV